MRILLVDDDEIFSSLLKSSLTEQRYTVDAATDGQEGWDFVESASYDLIILDVMLPKLDGISFCRRLRASCLQVPVLLLTGRSTSEDKIAGLDAGADDYVTKLVPLPELEARIRALLRRKPTTLSPVLEWGNLQLNLSQCEVTYSGIALNLTAKEYALIELFMQNPQKIYSQSNILSQLWSLSDEPASGDTIRALIKRSRQKFKTVNAADIIETVYGLGYRLNPAFQKTQPSQIPESPKQKPTANKQDSKSRILEQMDAIEQAIQQLQQNPSNNESRLIAKTEAHKLISSLSQLGLSQAAKVLQEIEMILKQELLKPLCDAPTIREAKAMESLHSRIQELRLFINNSSLPIAKLIPTQPTPIPDAKIMVLDDDKLILRFLETLLQPWGLQVTTLNNSQQFWSELETVTPDLLILDVQMPDTNGIELCQALRNHERWAPLPIVFLTGQRDTETIQNIFAAGADDYVSKPVVAPELITRIFNRLERTRLLREYAEKDSLTNLPNRHRSSQDLDRLIHLAFQYQQTFCLAVLTLDNLAQINRNYGHRIGDQMLRKLAQILRQELRNEDIISRWDGAEFVVGMYGITRGEGVEWLAQVLEVLRSVDFTINNTESITVTFSGGVTQYPEDGKDLQTLYQSAGEILEKAKDLEGNCILPATWNRRSQSFAVMDVILVHQDSAFATSVMSALLTRGYHAHWLKDGKTALDILAGNKPSLHAKAILIESNLPLLEGIEVLKHFKREKITQRSKVIWLSEESIEVEKAKNLGCVDYINVPCNISAFMLRLRQVLGSKTS